MSPIHEDDLRDELRHDPHPPLDPHALAASVASTGRGIRRRRQVIGLVAGVAAAALAVVLGVSALSMGTPGALSPGGKTSAGTVSVSTEATDEPSAQAVADTELPRLPWEGLTLAELEAATGSYAGETPFAPAPGIDEDFQPCHVGPQEEPLDTPVVGSKAISQSFGSGERAQGLIVFADPSDASAAMTEFAERLDRCAGFTESVASSRTELDGSYRMMQATVWSPDGPGFTGYYVIAEVGRSIVWTSDFGDGGGQTPTIAPSVERSLLIPVNELIPTLEERYVR